MNNPKTTLRQLKKNLNILREREAKYGRNVPLDLLNQIDDHEEAIRLTEQAATGEISPAEWQAALDPLLLAVRGGQVVKIEAETYIAGNVGGDMVTGDKVGRDKITQRINAPGSQINIGVSEAKAPDRPTVAAYLQRLMETIQAQQQSETELKSEALKRLWNQTFYVRRPGQRTVSRRALDQAIQDRLDLKRPAGVIRRAIVLLADAGVGKTPAFQTILYKVAAKSLPYFQAGPTDGPQPEYNLIPILIPLADLREGQQFLTLVRSAFNRFASEGITLDQTQKLLETYECLLMIDDLDKVAFSTHKGGIQLIREFMDNYPQERYVISCRTSGYHGQLGPMDVYVLDELAEEQVREVLGDGFDERLLPLARNRAMLQILITEGRHEAGQWSRGRLVQRMVWNQIRVASQDEGEIDLELVETMLEQLAYQMQQERVYAYTDRQLMEFITDYLAQWHETTRWRHLARFLRQTGVMVEDRHRQWRFCNRSTQAYFVAAAIYRDQSHLPPLLTKATEFWWQEPLELLVGLLDEPSELLFDLIDYDTAVAASCLQFVGQPVEQRVINALVDAMVEQMRHERAAGRERLVRILTEIGHAPPQEVLWQLLYRERKSLVILVIAQALANSKERSTSRKGSAPEIEAWEPQFAPELKEVIDLWQGHAVAIGDKEKKRIEQALAERLQQHKRRQEGMVSGLAAIALGFIGIDLDREEARRALLAELQTWQSNQFIAWCVVEALSQIKHQTVEQAAIDLYESKTGRVSRRKQQQRIHAVYLLGAVGGRFARTIDILNEALDDPHETLRGYAARAVGRLGLINAREQLEARLESKDPDRREQNSWVLRRIMEALSRVGTLESIPVLEPYLRHEQVRTRRRVREAIAEIRRRYELA